MLNQISTLRISLQEHTSRSYNCRTHKGVDELCKWLFFVRSAPSFQVYMPKCSPQPASHHQIHTNPPLFLTHTWTHTPLMSRYWHIGQPPLSPYLLGTQKIYIRSFPLLQTEEHTWNLAASTTTELCRAGAPWRPCCLETGRMATGANSTHRLGGANIKLAQGSLEKKGQYTSEEPQLLM